MIHAPAHPAPPLLRTVDQVADSLQVSKRTVESLIASGQLRSVTIGRSRRVYNADLNEFASRGTPEVVKAGLRAVAASPDIKGEHEHQD